MTAPALRPPGHYAVIDGVELPVMVSAYDYVKVAGDRGPVRHEMGQLDDLLSVGVKARWRGGDVPRNPRDRHPVGLNKNPRPPPHREGLGGDFYNGWHGSAPVSELSEITERVSSIHPRRREA
ncbi:MAG: hypothetical protein LH477_16530 [Nocardioides sp.]|nr:hypothetical protein [Nocardioides sp.]